MKVVAPRELDPSLDTTRRNRHLPLLYKAFYPRILLPESYLHVDRFVLVYRSLEYDLRFLWYGITSSV
jgi:hypothetical protein